MIQRDDGFTGLKALLPPPSRRGLVLIDPPYEVKDDYRRVKDTLEDAVKRFATGIYAVWYPLLQRMESRQLADRLKRIPANGWLDVTLSVAAPAPDGFGGLRSSGMFILNPPWTLEPMLRELMPWLVATLGQDQGAGFTLESGQTVTGQTVRRNVGTRMR
jgi:23S rRNA (adenine2030-N6)-methyltransferase